MLQYSSKTQEQLDKQIMRISERSDILRFLDPVNKFEELTTFLEKWGDYNPQFIYDESHLPALDEVMRYIDKLKSKVSKLRVKNTLQNMMIQKCEELECKFKLLQAYHAQDLDLIQQYNEQLFGPLQHQDITSWKTKAKRLESLHQISISSLIPKHLNLSQQITKKELLELIAYHLQQIWADKYKIQFGKYGTTNMQISIGPKPVIYINKKDQYALHDVCVSILHELYGHLLRYFNGKKSNIHIMQWWSAYYLATEEWVAVFSAARLEWLSKTLVKLYDNHQLLVQASEHNRSATSSLLQAKGSKDLEHIFWSLLRVKRWLKDTSISWKGSVFMKDKVYFDGYIQVINYLYDGHTRESLTKGRLDIKTLRKKDIS